MSYEEYFLYHEQISCSSFQLFTMLKISAGSEQHICQAYLRHEQEFSSFFRVFTILKTFSKFNQHVTRYTFIKLVLHSSLIHSSFSTNLTHGPADDCQNVPD